MRPLFDIILFVFIVAAMTIVAVNYKNRSDAVIRKINAMEVKMHDKMSADFQREPDHVEVMQDAYPSYGTCNKCGLPWAVCEGRTVMITKDIGIFAMCIYCWDHSSLEEKIKCYRKSYNYTSSRSYTVGQLDSAVQQAHPHYNSIIYVATP